MYILTAGPPPADLRPTSVPPPAYRLPPTAYRRPTAGSPPTVKLLTTGTPPAHLRPTTGPPPAHLQHWNILVSTYFTADFCAIQKFPCQP